jgi:hypothetical protein
MLSCFRRQVRYSAVEVVGTPTAAREIPIFIFYPERIGDVTELVRLPAESPRVRAGYEPWTPWA